MILPRLKQVWLLKNRYYSVNTAKPPFAAGDILMLKETYGKEGQVFGSSMYTVRWICMWNNIHNLMYRRVLPKTEAIAYTRRKRPAKQPCFDSEGEPHSAVERGGGGGGGQGG